ncbi:hypothetical protein [Propionibacterium australiense]|uniref:RusA-like resolvase n=1 Tax=Propionibacterium australiense TaxID=119981 RepID=A0A8B3FLB6_9ACTN|nr:hypothetical protein [Propionibacterium australiense]RLP12247.1 hypothetical protein D7U36_03025 [Propionibacterium australiense]
MGDATVEFVVPERLWMSSNRPVTDVRYRKRLVDGLHALAAWQARRARLAAPAPVCAACWTVSYPWRTGRADPTNAAPTTKALLDGLVQAGVLADDDSHIVTFEVFRRGPNLPRTHPRGAHTIELLLTTQQLPF